MIRSGQSVTLTQLHSVMQAVLWHLLAVDLQVRALHAEAGALLQRGGCKLMRGLRHQATGYLCMVQQLSADPPVSPAL